MFHPMPSAPTIHPTASVEEGAIIGDETSVWHHCHVRSNSRVGNRCVLGKNVYVDTGVIIGNGVKIQNNVSVFQGVSIGDDVFVGPSAVFTNDMYPRAHNSEWTVTKTVVEDGASIGANATIVCGVTIGKDAMIAAGSTVTRSVQPNELVAGIPSRTMGWVARCGHVISTNSERPPVLECIACTGNQ